MLKIFMFFMGLKCTRCHGSGTDPLYGGKCQKCGGDGQG